jgi:hypothetical protein
MNGTLSTAAGEIRELSMNEIDEVSGGAEVKVGPVHIFIGEGKLGIGFGVAIDGVGGFAITTDGTVCGAIKGLGGGCI